MQFLLRRRDFITLLGGAAAAWPLAARAQQRTMPVIGFVHSLPLDIMVRPLAAFHQGLKEAGYVDKQNVAIEYRSAEGPKSRLQAVLSDVVRRQVNVIVAAGSAISVVAKEATTIIPIVTGGGGDPVRLGLVASLNRPGGNITGVSRLSHGLAAKQFELLRELIPKDALIAVLINEANPNTASDLSDVQDAARAVGQRILILSAGNDSEIDAAIAAAVQQKAGGLLVGNDPFFLTRHVQLVAVTARHAMPAVYPFHEFTKAGGLMSYGASLPELFRQMSNLTGRTLKGEKPADLPIQQATKIDLIINLKTAKALDLTFPTSILVRADEVIE